MKPKIFISVSFLLILLLVSIGRAGVTGKIAGKVVDKKTGKPLPGVNIIIDGTSMGAATDEAGHYFIINIPVGTYSLRASMIGYEILVKKSVLVQPDFTTLVNFELQPTVIQGKVVVVEAKRPLVQKDVVSTSVEINTHLAARMPVSNLKDVIGTQASVVSDLTYKGDFSKEQFRGNPDDGLHFRGGRSNETGYYLDGIRINNPLYGAYDLGNFPIIGLESVQLFTGTFEPQYGNAMSGIVNLVPPEGSRQTKILYNYFTDQPGRLNTKDENTYNNDLFLSGAVPGTRKKILFSGAARYYTTDGRFYGYIYPDYRDSEGKDKSGTPQKIPMAYKDNYTGYFQLTYHVSSNLKIKALTYGSQIAYSEYLHFYKYNPYGAPRYWRHQHLGLLKVTHVINKKMYHSLGLVYSFTDFKGKTYDDIRKCMLEKHIISPEFFSVSGVDYIWKYSNTHTDGLKYDWVFQVNSIHQLKAGFEYNQYNLHMERRNPTQANIDDPTKMKAWESYTRQPNLFSAYFSDKMEFQDIGMVLNVGLRYDRMDPKTKWVKNINLIQTSPMFKVKPKSYISPRIGVSYPISDKTAFRFSYGVFYQYPHFYLLYQRLNDESPNYPNPTVTELTTGIGNANMKAERTTSYEVGVQHAIGPDISLNVAAFYRDMADLVGRRYITGPNVPRDYYMFDNVHYGVAKGVDIIVKKKFSRHFSGYVDYTYSNVRTSGSSVLYFPTISINRLFTADWDQPHILHMALDIRQPNKWGVDIMAYFASGMPYTVELEPNTERGPWLHQVDIQADKVIRLLGIKGRFYLRAMNVFNLENVYWVYSDTGRPGVDNNPATSSDYTRNPTAWGPTRKFFFGLIIGQ